MLILFSPFGGNFIFMKRRPSFKLDYKLILKSFVEASSMSISFVFYPVIILLLATFLGKRFGNLPLFIVSAVVLGFVIFVFQVRKIFNRFSKIK